MSVNGYFDTSYGGVSTSHALRIEWSRTGTWNDSSGCGSNIYYKVYGIKGSNTSDKDWHTCKNVNIYLNGSLINTFWSGSGNRLYNGTLVGEGNFSVKHNDNGDGYFSMSADAYIYSAGKSGSGEWWPDSIPRNSYTNSYPTWTAPGSVTCTINRYSSFTHTVCLDLKNSNGDWENIGVLYDQGTSATFSGESVMKRAFEVLNGRASCESRFTIGTNGPNGWTSSPIGTCTAASINTCTAPTFTGTNSATTTITKGNSAFTSTISVVINGQTIGSVSQTSDTSFTFNNTTSLRKACITGLAQASSKSYSITITTYYSGVKVRSSTSGTGTCYAPNVDRITTPNFTAGNDFNFSVTTDSSELSRSIVLQIQNGSGAWVSIASQSATTTQYFTWANTEYQRDIIFSALNRASSRSTRLLVTTYYSGVQVRGADAATYGTCTAPAASTCNAGNWTAGSIFTCKVNRASSLLTHTIVLQVKDSSGNLQTIQSISKTSYTSLDFISTTTLNTTLFNYLAQAGSRETKITITTYYKDIVVRSALSYTGTVTAPAASTLTTTPSWVGGDNLNLSISRENSAFTHTVTVKVNSQTITTLTGVGTSTSFGTSEADRIKIFTALAQSASKNSEVLITTYYNGVQVRTTTSKTGTCYSPAAASPSAPTWTAGNSFSANITLSKSYLLYSIELKVGTVSIQSYNYTRETQLGFAGSADINIKAYQGLNKNAQATSQFIVRMYYRKEDGTYIQVGPASITNGTCTALEANTITNPNWIAGSSFNATITRKSVNLYSTIKLKVNGQVVQEYIGQSSSNLNFTLTFANTKDANTKIYTALAQTASKPAILEITTYFGTSTSNMVQVRTAVQSSGTCNSSAVATGNLTLSQTPAIIDNTKVTCDLAKPLADYTISVEVRYNNTLITTLTPTAAAPNVVEFNSASFIQQLYRAIPTQKSASLQFKIITKYNEVQVQQPKVVAVDMNAKEDTVKVKIDTSIDFNTSARVLDKTNTFIDDTSMMGSKLSDLAIAMARGFFYLESKYGGYISQVKIQIANASSMMKVYNYTESEIIYNTEKTKIVTPAFTNTNSIIMGPYDFPSVTEAGTINNLVISATDSRGYVTSKIIPLKIFPYSSPTVKIDNNSTVRDSTNKRILSLTLSGTISSLYKESSGTKTQTNLLTSDNNEGLILQYREYGSTAAYSTIKPIPRTYNSSYTSYTVTKWQTAALFDTNKTYEILVTAKDAYGRTNTDTMIILPDTPLLSFRDSQIGINIVPRQIGHITERSSEDGENPALDVNGYIYSNGREVPSFTIVETWTV